MSFAVRIANVRPKPPPRKESSVASQQGQRLRFARLNAGYATARAACRANGWNENTYRTHEGNWREISKKGALAYGKAFNVSFVWLMTGEDK